MEPRFNFTLSDAERRKLDQQVETVSSPTTLASRRSLDGSVMAELREIRQRREQLEHDKLNAVDKAVQEGFSWGQIGQALGIARQGARRWYLRRANPQKPKQRRMTELEERLAELGYRVFP